MLIWQKKKNPYYYYFLDAFLLNPTDWSTCSTVYNMYLLMAMVSIEISF